MRKSPISITDAVLGELRELNARGFSDADISRSLNCGQSTISKYRREMGLPCNRFNGRHRQKMSGASRRRCERAGVASLVELRWSKERVPHWPEGLWPREYQILDALWERGPMSRQEICEAIGKEWKGPRQSLKCKGPHGSYMARLQAFGLVMYLGRRGRGRARPPGPGLYALTWDAEPVETPETEGIR